ncbi:MAG: hypothetical protein JXA07_04030 [Spirochaetes bacterium]|nr:hypothetical protein [Spirochaetota bacterium]
MTTSKRTRTQMIREYFQNVGPATIARAAVDLNIPQRTVRKAIESLQARGEATRIGSGLYKYRQPEGARDSAVYETQRTMWRAMRISKTFTVWDVAQLSGASIDYAQRYVAFLAKGKYLLPAGKDGQRPRWRIILKAPVDAPVMVSASNRAEEARIARLEAAWELMRAIYAGDMAAARAALVKVEGNLQ